MAKIIYIYKSTKNRVANFGNIKHEYLFYGFNYFNNKNYAKDHNISMLSNPLLMHLFNIVFNFFFANFKKKYGSLNFYDAFLGIIRIRSNKDIIFSTVDSIGLILLFLKKYGFINNKIIYSSIGLLDRKKLPDIKYILKYSDHIICYTNYERQKLISDYDIDSTKISALRFPATHINHISAMGHDFDVISAGNDLNRNFSSILTLAEVNCNLNFLIITSKSIISKLNQHIPYNCTIYTDVPSELFDYYVSRAKIGVLSINENTYSYGAITAMNFCSHGLPVIINKINLFNYEDITSYPFIFSADNTPKALSEELLKLNRSPKLFEDFKNRSLIYAKNNSWVNFNHSLNNIINIL